MPAELRLELDEMAVVAGIGGAADGVIGSGRKVTEGELDREARRRPVEDSRRGDDERLPSSFLLPPCAARLCKRCCLTGESSEDARRGIWPSGGEAHPAEPPEPQLLRAGDAGPPHKDRRRR